MTDTNKDIQKAFPKPIKERDNLDLLQLVCELYARTGMYPNNRELHEACFDAKRELESRLTNFQSFSDYLKRNLKVAPFVIATHDYKDGNHWYIHPEGKAGETFDIYFDNSYTPPPTESDVQKAAEEIIPNEQNWKDVMLKLGKAHDDLAKTSLSAIEYRQISRLLTEVKVWLFHHFNSLAGTQWKGEEVADQFKGENEAIAFAEWVSETYCRVDSEELDKWGWVNFKEENILLHGSDFHYTTLLKEVGKTTVELYQIFKSK